MNLFFIITAFGLATVCLGARQQWIFHTELGCTGHAFIWQNKKPDVTFAEPIIANSKSVSITGVWGLFRGVNYTDSRGAYGGSDYNICSNTEFTDIQSLRYLGPPDTTTHSISLYQEELVAGEELTITEQDFAPIPFVPQSMFITGNTNWTFYTGNNFDGDATCVIPPNPPSQGWYTHLPTLNSTLSNVGSIIRGCNNRIDKYYSI